jgi:outer membrane receptor protein involved in Fe transport
MRLSHLARALSLVNTIALTLAMLVPLARPAMAQATTGTLRGTVADANGAAVTGATVRVKNEATGQESEPVTTTGEGTFEFVNLKPGKYTVTVEGAGFKRSVTTGTDVKVGIINPLDVKLEPGNIAETVTVTAGTEEVLNTEQAQIAHTFEARKIEDLPSNAQGFGIDTLALLVPGVAQNSGGGTNTNGTGLSVNGNRGRSNNFQIDGSDNNDLSIGGPNLFVDNQDQVQEYQVITNNFSAQYGHNQGAIVNIVTKSGGNNFHGTAFEYHMDRRNLDSLNNIERTQCVAGQPCYPPRFLSNVFGGTLGGPIYIPHFGEGGKAGHFGRDRAFFFFSYQGIRQPQTSDILSSGFAIDPADLPRLAAAFPNSPIVQDIVALNPSVLPLGTIRPRTDLLNCNATDAKAAGSSSFARCNRDYIDFNPTTNPANAVRVNGFLIERIFPVPFTQNEWSLRGDMKVTNKDSFYVRYLDQKGITVNGEGGSNGFTGNDTFSTKNFGGTYTRQINSRMVNEFKAVRSKIDFLFGGGCDPHVLGCIPDVSQINAALIESFTPSAVRGVTLTGNSLRPVGLDITAGTGLPQGRTTTLYDFADNLTWARGRHSIIFGGELKYTNAIAPFLPNFGGAFTFAIDTASGRAAQQRIFADAPSAVSIALGDPSVKYTEWDQYYFVQDDFKIRPNLTLNLGVRYEFTGQPINALTDETIARESNAATALWNTALPLSARTVPRTPSDKNNWAPRVGFAYTPHFWKRFFGEDASVIRGGYAIAYDPAFYNILLNVANVAPFSLSLSATSVQLPDANPILPLTSIFGSDIRQAVQSSGVLPIGKLDPKWVNQTQVARNFHSPYSQQWSLGFQRQVGKNNVAEVSYVGNHGVSLFQGVLRNPFVGVAGNYVAQPGVPASAVGLPIATTPCTPGGSSTLPNCIGGFYGFTRNLSVNGVTTAVQFPSFAAQIIPAGIAGLSCVDVTGTPDNEGACNGRILPQAAITDRENTAISWYHSLQARYNGRFINNTLNLGATYTFSKTTDTASEIFSFNGEGSIAAQNPFNLNADYGISALHHPHIFSLNAIYDVPFHKEQRGIIGHLLGGWQLNATHVYNTGRRYTPSQGFNNANLGLGSSYLSGGSSGNEPLRPFLGNPSAPQNTVGISQIDAFLFFSRTIFPTITNLSGFLSLNDLNNGVVRSVTPSDVRFIYNGPGSAKLFGTPYGNVPRYYLVGPPINQMNFSVFKSTRAFEKVNVQFRADFFNVLNHPQPGYGVTRATAIPNTLLDNAGNASTPFADNTSFARARRRIQFGLRISF